MTISVDIIIIAEDYPKFLNRIISRRNGVFPLRSATETTISQQGKKRKKKTSDKTGQKAMSCLNCFLIQMEFFYVEFIPEGAPVNKTSYKEIFGRLCYSIHLSFHAQRIAKIGNNLINVMLCQISTAFK